VLLAGGAGTRMGGSKLTVALGGRPLFSYPLAALSAALEHVVVIGKPGLALPGLGSVAVWSEPVLPRHPLVGIAQALALAEGRPVLVCPADLPFVTAELIARLARAGPDGVGPDGVGPDGVGPDGVGPDGVGPDGALAVIAVSAGALQPLLGRYEPAAVRPLAEAARAELPARAAVAGLRPRLLDVVDPDELFNVNTRADLARAAAMVTRLYSRFPSPRREQ
jgi:molybdopterin-guanine dinucleotide biosynthesis protein A